MTKEYNRNGIFLRKIRSFVSRNRKLSSNKYDFINKNWSKFGINFQSSYLDMNSIFCSYSPVVLEIGFGMSDSFFKTALNNMSKNFLGIEVHLPGVISCLQNINLYCLKNIRIIYHDAVEVLNSMIDNSSLSKVQMFFPDPWPKKRHQKRRIFTKNFAQLILKKLIPNGILHISTDCKSYAEQIITIIRDIDRCIISFQKNIYISKSISRPITKFEQRGINLGNTIFDLIFKLV
ncbi:MAG: tRNA (guanosine(46)-N7)-methyltransferase TrmB [Buchnera aphidicola (Floraphis choui)]